MKGGQSRRRERGEIVLGRVQIFQRCELRIDSPQLLDENFARTDFIEQEAWSQSVGVKQSLNMYEDRRAIDGGERMMMLLVARDGDVVIAQQLEHAPHESRHEQRHVATGHVDGVCSIGDRPQPGRQALEWTSLRTIIVSDGHTCGEFRQRLAWRGDHHDLMCLDNLAQQPDDSL